MPNISIITIGDELLIGQVIDTNSAWMAQQLNAAGLAVLRRVAVGDNKNSIINALEQEQEQADAILITGGLGPTADDITKPLLCEYFGGKMVPNDAALENVKRLFEQIFKRPVTPVNIKQAEVPDCCTVIQNKLGTAPGMIFEKNNTIFVSMPGVPHEMQGMMEQDVIPLLQKRFGNSYIVHRTLVTFGIGESNLSDMIQPFETALPANIKLAYLPNFGMVRLRLTSSGTDKEKLDAAMHEQFSLLKKEVKDYLLTDEDEPMEKIVGKLLLKQNKTLGTAESCTGGYIAQLITSMPGSSAYFKGSVVSYSNEVKETLLKVKETTLQQYGAVSEETVSEMAAGALDALKTDYALAVSGIMGPGGGSAEKPVGTVWIAAANKERMVTQKLHFRFGRLRNIQLTSVNALNLLRKLIIE
ncbi:MAG: competence/damage-inducible protein A [Ferruginibacter sp.]